MLLDGFWVEGEMLRSKVPRGFVIVSGLVSVFSLVILWEKCDTFQLHSKLYNIMLEATKVHVILRSFVVLNMIV